MIELLTLCGYENQDIESELSRIQRVFKILGIDSSDIERGKKRLNTFYDMNLQGVRKAIGLCIKSAMDTVLAREDGKRKIIHSFMAPGMELLGTALISKSEDIYVSNLNGPLQFLLGGMFDKMSPVLEAAEKRWLKGGKAYHCANVKATLGFLELGLVPRPDLLVTSGLLCDTAPKSTDLIQELYGIPVFTYDSCIDSDFSDFPDFKRIIEYASKSARRLAKRIEEVVGFEITDSMLMESIDARAGIARNIEDLKSVMETGDPVPISAAHDIIWNCVATISSGISGIKQPEEVLGMALLELKEKIKKGEGMVGKGAPRVLALLPPHYSDPRWEHLPYEYGIALVSCETGFFPPYGERVPYVIDEDLLNDPYARMIMGVQSSLNQNIKVRCMIIVEACKRLNVEGILGKYHVGCRINVGDAMVIKDYITEQLGIPVLLLEWEGFDPRVMNEEHFKKQLDTFRDVMESNRRRKQK